MSVFSASSLSASDASFNRRVKPLPKRRRISRAGSDDEGTDNFYASPSYYHPIYSGRVDRLKQESNATPFQSNSAGKDSSFPARSRAVDDADAEGDYTDHLQQPNNTKKRKVPAAATIGATRDEPISLHDEEKPDDNIPYHPRVNLSGEGTGPTLDTPESNPSPTIVSRRKKCSPVTLATLQLKELLTARRKMMVAVIGDDVDPLALEFALSAPFARSPTRQPSRAWSYGPKFRRRPRNNIFSMSRRGDCLSGAFTFSFVNPTSTRYTLAKKAATSLQLRFQTELARQATTAAEIALKTASQLSSGLTAGQRKKLDPGSGQVTSIAPGTDVAQPAAKASRTKKKRRSVLANASNPHHLRNYVPSRMPQSNSHPPSSSAHGQSSNYSLGPLALKFVAATLPPRRRGRTSGNEGLGPSLVRPEDEWICPFCEYSLLYSDSAAMHRAVKNRKKVLIRRRNARERAAAAASGTTVPASQDVSEDEESGEDENSFDDAGGAIFAPVSSREAAGAGARQYNPGPHPGG